MKKNKSSTFIYTLKRRDAFTDNIVITKKTVVRTTHANGQLSTTSKVDSRVLTPFDIELMTDQEFLSYGIGHLLSRNDDEDNVSTTPSFGLSRRPKSVLTNNSKNNSNQKGKTNRSSSSLSTRSNRSKTPHPRPSSAPLVKPWVGVRDLNQIQTDRYCKTQLKELEEYERSRSPKPLLRSRSAFKLRTKKEEVKDVVDKKELFVESHMVVFDEERIPMASDWNNPRKYKFQEMPNVNKLSPFERMEYETVAVTNLLRTRPQAFARVLEMNKEFYSPDGREYRVPGKTPLVYPEGIQSLLACIQFLKKQKALPPLSYSRGLSFACRDHIEDTGSKGITGHEGTDGSTYSERCERYGKFGFGSSGENIAYGTGSGFEQVMNLLLNDIGGGHRQNIFTETYKVMGVGIGRHAEASQMCVCIYATSFLEKGKQSSSITIPNGVTPQYTGPLVPPQILNCNWSKVFLTQLDHYIATLEDRKKQLKAQKLKSPALKPNCKFTIIHPLGVNLVKGSRVDFVFKFEGGMDLEQYMVRNNNAWYPLRIMNEKYICMSIKQVSTPSVCLMERTDKSFTSVIEYKVLEG